jgi:protein-S-isoprenylcysteine O-methyltransferase Ste14
VKEQLSKMPKILFAVALIAELGAAVCVLFSIIFPQKRIWPPPHIKTWQSNLMRMLFSISGIGVILLGLVDWGNFFIPNWLRFAIGIPIWLAGNVLAIWAFAVLGFKKSYGDTNELICRGPYKFSRNPQYVGFISGLIGWGLLASSGYTILVSIAGSLALFLAPFAEETWLKQHYGSAYLEYQQETPRFIII